MEQKGGAECLAGLQKGLELGQQDGERSGGNLRRGPGRLVGRLLDRGGF
jgi:hypothetical protein